MGVRPIFFDAAQLSFGCHCTISNQKLDVFSAYSLLVPDPPPPSSHSSYSTIYIIFVYCSLPTSLFILDALWNTFFQKLFYSREYPQCIVCANVFVFVCMNVVFSPRLARLCSISYISLQFCTAIAHALLLYDFCRIFSACVFFFFFPSISTLLHFVDSGCVLVLY